MTSPNHKGAHCHPRQVGVKSRREERRDDGVCQKGLTTHTAARGAVSALDASLSQEVTAPPAGTHVISTSCLCS